MNTIINTEINGKTIEFKIYDFENHGFIYVEEEFCESFENYKLNKEHYLMIYLSIFHLGSLKVFKNFNDFIESNMVKHVFMYPLNHVILDLKNMYLGNTMKRKKQETNFGFRELINVITNNIYAGQERENNYLVFLDLKNVMRIYNLGETFGCSQQDQIRIYKTLENYMKE